MSKHFNYYEDWKSAVLECPQCQWSGKFMDGDVGYYRELMDSSCPKCDLFHAPILAIVSYPTLKEMRSSGDPADVSEAARIEQFQQSFEAQKLRSKDQLPDLDPPPFALAWDLIEAHGERRTVIRYGDRVLFSEPALWEGYERFERISKIVRDKYGKNVTDLVPTSASEMYLYGDDLSSPDFVSNVRRKVFGHKRGSRKP
jgi:hypothetical protein